MSRNFYNGWNDQLQCEQRHPSLRASRRSHEEADGRASSKALQTTSRQSRSHRRDDVQKAPPQSARHSRDDVMASRAGPSSGRAGSSVPLSARTTEPKSRSAHTHRKMESATHSMTRSSPHFGTSRNPGDRRHVGQQDPPSSARGGYSEAEWPRTSRARCSGREHQPSRTLPGEELHTPMYSSFKDPIDEPLHMFMPLSSRSNPQQSNVHSSQRRSGDRIESRCHSARCYAQRPYSTMPPKGLQRSDSEGPKLKPEKDHVKSRRKSASGLGPHPWSMGSSVATSAQGSFIDSCPSDLWETSSVDSLPLGAEWFNFMHGRK